MLTRRTLIRSLSLAAVAVSCSRFLSACGGSPRDPDEVDGLVLVSSEVDRAVADPAAVPVAVASVHALAAGLARTMMEAAGNVALSPFSVGVALAMTALGARGDTELAMLAVLGGDDCAALARGHNGLTRHVEGLAGPVEVAGDERELVLDAASAVFAQRGEAWEQPFLDALAREYGAGLRTVDFAGDVEAAGRAVDEWTAASTHERIEGVVPESGLDPATRLVLVNALYLDAPWATPFDETRTEERDFHRVDGSVVRVPTMSEPRCVAAVGAGDGWRSARIPYARGGLAMTVVLPDPGRLDAVEQLVAAGGLAEVLAAAGEDATVDLALPTFTFDAGFDLTDALTTLGMGIAFTSDADFGAMTSRERLTIARVAHRVHVAVDEQGTEAAAVTSVEVGPTSAPETGAPFAVDRPFLFVVHDTEYGVPLFLGRVDDPSAP